MATLLLAALLLCSTASATPGTSPTLRGVLEHEASRHHGAVTISNATQGAMLAGWSSSDPGRLPQLVWRLEAESLVLNRTLLRQIGIGNSLRDPEHSTADVQNEYEYEETSHRGVAAEGPLDTSTAVLLAVANQDGLRETQLHVVGSVALDPAVETRWYAGIDTGRVPPSQPDALSRVHDVPAGVPNLNTSSPFSYAVRGDLTLVVWGGNPGSNVTFADAEGERDLRTGRWREDPVGTQVDPRGVARRQMAQLLELRALEATLTVSMTQGTALLAAADLNTLTYGSVEIVDGRGRLETPGGAYEPTNETFRLDGWLRTSARSGATGRLTSELDGDVRTTLSMAGGPSGPLTAPALEPSLTLPADPIADRWWTGPLAYAGVAGLFAVVGLVVVWTRRRARTSRDELLARAEVAIIEGRPRTARRLVARLLRRDPGDADGWFLHVTSFAQERNHARVVKELEARADHVRQAPGIAMLLALSYARLGDPERARDWSRFVAKDPLAWAAFEEQAEYETLFPGRPRRSGSPDVAYA